MLGDARRPAEPAGSGYRRLARRGANGCVNGVYGLVQVCTCVYVCVDGVWMGVWSGARMLDAARRPRSASRPIGSGCRSLRTLVGGEHGGALEDGGVHGRVEGSGWVCGLVSVCI